MRLTEVLLKWPKIRPKGNIWIGKKRMVGKVLPYMEQRMTKDFERERQNIKLCINPAVSFDAEDAYFKHLKETGPRPDQIWWALRNAKLRNSVMAPIPLSNHYESLNKSNKFVSD